MRRLDRLESGALPVQHVAVNHLATRYLAHARRRAAISTPRRSSLTVALPAGIASRPSFYWSALGTAAVRSRSTATRHRCGALGHLLRRPDGYLALPNPSLTADAQVFTVSGSLTVDTTRSSDADGAADPLYTGPTVAAPGGDVAPSILVYGAELFASRRRHASCG